MALNRGFFETLPEFDEVDPSEADIAWFVYDLVKDNATNVYKLTRYKAVYTKFMESLEKITQSEPGDVGGFIDVLQSKVTNQRKSGGSSGTEACDGVV